MTPSGTTQGGQPEELSPTELAAWRGMLRLTHRLRHNLGAELTRQHALSMADYDALLTVASQPGRSMRMADLAEEILQPRSSLTRIVGSLEDRGLLRRESTPADGRGAVATLTAKGARQFAQAHRTHVQGIRDRFLRHLTQQQLEQLATAWQTIDQDIVDP